MRCNDLDPVVVPYVDEEAPSSERADVDAHLARCQPCRERVDAERAARAAIRSERDRLREHAPAALRSRCSGLCSHRHRVRRWLPLSLAAAAGLVVALIWTGTTDAGTPVLAAQLTLDHVKCFKFGSQRVTGAPSALADYWREQYGWPIVVPAALGTSLRLSGVRRCASSDGQTAHIMYSYNGAPVSLFVARDSPQGGRTHRTIRMFGEHAVVWSQGERTYVLVGDEPRDRMESLAALLRKEIPTR